MIKKTVLFLFNSSIYAVEPWLNDGRFNCVSIDYDNTDHSGAHRRLSDHPNHYRLNIDLMGTFAALDIDSALIGLRLDEPSFILSFAPCTDLAVSGNAHRAAKLKRDPHCIRRAVDAARLVEWWGCPSIVENPVSILSTEWKRPTGYVHPWQFSYLLPDWDVHPEFPEIYPSRDWYNKKTGLWCQNGAIMPEVDYSHVKGPKGQFPGHVRLGGKSAKTKYIRSLTPRGLAEAIYLANRGTHPPLKHDTISKHTKQVHEQLELIKTHKGGVYYNDDI